MKIMRTFATANERMAGELSWLERMIHNHEVPGSIPGPATKRKSLDIRHLRGFHS